MFIKYYINFNTIQYEIQFQFPYLFVILKLMLTFHSETIRKKIKEGTFLSMI